MLDHVPDRTKDFIRVRCPDCGNEQMLFSKSNTVILCLVCGTTLAKPTGGRCKIEGEVIEVES